MMLNYMKSELYRIVHGRELYLFTGVPCAIVLASSVLLWAMASTPDFPYATVRFSLSNLISMLPSLFLLAGLLVWVLFADDRKDGTFKNAVADGCSRRDLFVGKCLVSTGLGLASMTVILAVYVGSAVLLLEGPADAVSILLKGVAAALPFTVACVVLGVAVCSVLPKTSAAFLVWLAIVASCLRRCMRWEWSWSRWARWPAGCRTTSSPTRWPSTRAAWPSFCGTRRRVWRSA